MNAKPHSTRTRGLVTGLALRGNDRVRFADLPLKHGDHLIDDEIADIGRIAVATKNLVAGHHEAPRHGDEHIAEVLRAMRAK